MKKLIIDFLNTRNRQRFRESIEVEAKMGRIAQANQYPVRGFAAKERCDARSDAGPAARMQGVQVRPC